MRPVINLAAQAGVRYSLKNPHAYVSTNVQGFLNILEACRHNGVGHLVYASSSSVYGGNTTWPAEIDHLTRRTRDAVDFFPIVPADITNPQL
jgi:UDP-glucuronate 4-epimerase